MPTQTMAGGDVAEIDGAPPVDDEAILKTTLVGFSVCVVYRGAERRENRVEMLRNEVERMAKELGGSSKFLVQ